MMLPVNTLLKERDSETILRVLDEVASGETPDPTSTHFVLIDIHASGAMPFFAGKLKTLSRIASEELIVIDEVFLPVNLGSLTEYDKQLLERRQRLVDFMRRFGQRVWDEGFRGRVSRRLAACKIFSKPFFYDVLRLYWQRGQTKEAIVTSMWRCGAPGELRIPKVGAPKPGRPRTIQPGVGVAATEEHRLNMRLAWASAPVGQDGRHLKKAWEWMLISRYFEHVKVLPKSGTSHEVAVENYDRVPTFEQFEYHWRQEYPFHIRQLKRLQQRRFDLAFKPLLSGTLPEVRGPGTRYYIDATVLDVYAVSRFNPRRIVGRPTLYVVIDQFSRMVVGIYVGLEPPCWAGAMLALWNCSIDKVAFCKAYGIEITADMWPIGYMPLHLMGDRGELKSEEADRLSVGFSLDVENARGYSGEAMPWLLAAARDAVRLAAFSDALRHLEPVLAFDGAHAEALRLRAQALDAMGDPAAVAAYRTAAGAADEPMSHNLRAQGALAQIKQGDPKGALEALVGVRPTSVEGRLCEALTYSGAAALGAADPAMGTQKAAEARRLALQAGDTLALVTASWAQAAAAHARGELDRSVWADLRDTSQLPHLAVRVFDGQLCILQRFLYGARPYPEVIAFAEGLAAEALRLGAARGHAFGITIRGEAELLAGDLSAAEEHLTLGTRLHHAIGGATGEAFATQRLAEVAMHRGRHDDACALVAQALDLARQTDIGFHLLDRIYGTRILLARGPAAALHALQDAREAVRGPLETCPGCRITFAVPAAIAAARAGRVDLAEEYAGQTAYLANVVMRLPAWHAAHEEVLGHMAVARREGAAVAAARFADAAGRFRDAGHPIDALRCERLAADAGSGRVDECETN